MVAGNLMVGGCGDSEAERLAQHQRDAIRRVMEMDKAYAQVRNQHVSADDLSSAATACQKYVEVMAATDMSDLPPDVRDAYTRHIQAWRDMATVLDHYSGYTGAFLKGYDGEAGKAKYDAAGKVIDDTWKDVKAKAAAHGVDTSVYP